MNTSTDQTAAVIADRPAVPAWRRAALLRRSVFVVLVVMQIAAGTYYMLAILPYHGQTGVEKALVAVFALLFGWISAGFWTAVTGFAVRRMGGDRYSLAMRYTAAALGAAPLGRTAVVMPVCNEPVGRITAGLRAIFLSLYQTGCLGHFDFFLLSDSRAPEQWLEEQKAWYRVCEELDAFGRIHYRRRAVNRRYKSGNVGDFLRRWGRDYDYMIILDADSLMSGETIVRLVQLMWQEPGVGIIQTKPVIVNAQTGFARVQQFASHTLGPLIAEGLAALQLGEAAYWGHNAIIRVRPFMQYCGLRSLPAWGLFRGPMLSHDFVEAAYMGRAGYEVWLEPALHGSFEESPPSLDDELLRDRRWIKGNLQHLWVLLTARNLRFTHRVTFVNGILSYLTAPLWFAFLVLSGVETLRFALWPIDYFPLPRSLFPLWPQWHPEWAVQLAVGTAAVLFFPKVLAFADIVLSGAAPAYGGIKRASAGFLAELAASTLMAPIRMVAHTRFVLGALFNIHLHWGGQNRHRETTWPVAIARHGPAALLAAAWCGFALWLQPAYLLWSLPVALPLIFAAPTSVWLGRHRAARWMVQRGILCVPEDPTRPAPIAPPSRTPDAAVRDWDAFEEAIIDPRCNALHVAVAALRRRGAPGRRLRQALERCLREGAMALSPAERGRLVQDAACLRELHRRAWAGPSGSYWGRRVDAVRRRGTSIPLS